jgi:hypothetical protein
MISQAAFEPIVVHPETHLTVVLETEIATLVLV